MSESDIVRKSEISFTNLEGETDTEEAITYRIDTGDDPRRIRLYHEEDIVQARRKLKGRVDPDNYLSIHDFSIKRIIY